jgi:hypothetical protein
VPFSFPRAPELRFAPEFVSLVREISDHMRGFSGQGRSAEA